MVDIATMHQLSANVSVSREVINVFSCTNTSMVELDEHDDGFRIIDGL